MAERKPPSPLFWLAWHALAVGSIVAMGGVRFGAPPWALPDSIRAATLWMALGYGLSAALAHIVLRFRAGGLWELVLSLAAGFSVVFAAFVMFEYQPSRVAILAMLAAAGGLYGVGFVLGPTRLRWPLVALLSTGLAGATYTLATTDLVLRPTGGPAEVVDLLDTSLYGVRATRYANHIPATSSFHAGGGLDLFGDGYVLVTADGDLYRFGWDADGGGFQVRALPMEVPLGRDAFIEASGRGGWVEWFRAFDVLVREEDTGLRLFVSHHRWDPVESCFTVRVSAIDVTASGDPLEGEDEQWDVIYDTRPCLPLVTSQPNWPFRGMEGGGRMAFDHESRLILTVGDQGFNGVDFERDWVQSTDADYGKSLVIDTETGTAEILSLGHRNPQGLWVGPEGSIWMTEHGPRGGDELNRITPGENYGWPLATYGTDYGANAWPLSPAQGRHEGFPPPMYSWIPSIGASNLVAVQGDLFGFWKGDLLIGTLTGGRLERIRMEGDRVAMVESIELSDRIRDIVEAPDGRLVLWLDSYTIMRMEPTQLVYAACAGCHFSGADGLRGLGPDLTGVVGRPVASFEGYPYSAALQALDGAWTEERLDAFLADPQSVAPGTTMVMPGIVDPELRAQIIEYLSTGG